MDEKFRSQMEENGADVAMTLKRFMGNEAIYTKFILKFLDDKNYENIANGIEQGDYVAAFNGAHSLKGVAGNLGLNPIYEAASDLSELLRGVPEREVDLEGINAVKARLEDNYNRFKDIIRVNKP